MNKIIAETERLILREITVNDTKAVYDLNDDPDVVRYTSDPAFKNLDEAKELILNNIQKQYADNGFGRWAVILKSTGAFTGWCGLKLRDGATEVDLGYRFMKKFWGYGYATEAAMASIKYGFETAGLNRIIGMAMEQNTASIKVLEKCGMKFCRKDFMHDHDALVYEIFKTW